MVSHQFNVEVKDHLLFPVRLTTLMFHGTEPLNAEILALYEGKEEYRRNEFLEQADRSNMLRLCADSPAVARLRDMFLLGLQYWMNSEKLLGKYRADMLMFPVYYSNPQQFVPPHNHSAHVTSIYYVRTADPGGQEILLQGEDGGYFRSDQGTLLLHDPKFNASLMQLTNDDYVKIVPRPGLLAVLPGYLWHTGSPNDSAVHRMAVVADFILHPDEVNAEESYSVDLEVPVPGSERLT